MNVSISRIRCISHQVHLSLRESGICLRCGLGMISSRPCAGLSSATSCMNECIDGGQFSCTIGGGGGAFSGGNASGRVEPHMRSGIILTARNVVPGWSLASRFALPCVAFHQVPLQPDIPPLPVRSPPPRAACSPVRTRASRLLLSEWAGAERGHLHLSLWRSVAPGF